MIIFYTHLSHVKIQFDRSFISLYIISLLHKFLFALHSTPKCWTLEIDERFKFLTQHHRVRPNTIVCVQNEKCPYFWRHSAVVCLYIFNDIQLSFVYLFLHFSRRDKSVRVWKIRSFEIVHYFFSHHARHWKCWIFEIDVDLILTHNTVMNEMIYRYNIQPKRKWPYFSNTKLSFCLSIFTFFSRQGKSVRFDRSFILFCVIPHHHKFLFTLRSTLKYWISK